jgi:hypothetical protein
MGDRRNAQIPVLGNMFKHKHFVLDKRNINATKRYFGVVLEEQRLSKALSPLKGILKSDERPWPYR